MASNGEGTYLNSLKDSNRNMMKTVTKVTYSKAMFVTYTKELYKVQNYFFVLAQRMKIDKRQKHVFDLYDNKIYVIRIRGLRIRHSIMT